jgi:hypothetical protein
MASNQCRIIGKNLSAYADGQLSLSDRQSVALHLARCPQCAARSQQMHKISRSLRSLPAVNAPAQLTTVLRVIASREIVRRNSSVTAAALIADWRSSARVWTANLMRPFALPVAGGLLSTLMLFAILVPNFVPPAVLADNDVPTILNTEASIRSTGPLAYTDDVEVELSIDEQGRVVDYTLPASVMQNPVLRRTIENNLLFTRFNPATTFGRAISGKVRLSFKKSHIEVKG